MAGLPKKYAKMGFKKGWAAYKRSKTKRSPSTTSTPTKYKRRKMAKRKTTRRRSSRRATKVFGVNLSKAGAAMLYGAMREKGSNLLAPYTSKIPLGNISDEVGMFAGAALLKKFVAKKAGILRDALTIGQSIEMARIGEAAISGQLGINLPGMTSNGASASSGNIF